MGKAGGNRVHLINNSSAPGVVVSGTGQFVGAIDGSGNLQVNAGSDLTANHIVQSALMIGGAAGNPARVAIDASDSAGNPLGQSSDVSVHSLLDANGAFIHDLHASPAMPMGDEPSLGDLNLVDANPIDSGAALPEPTALALVIAGLALFSGWVATRKLANRIQMPHLSPRRYPQCI